MKNLWKIFVNGLFKENPVLKLVLGCCSVLAVSVTVLGSLGMGAALTFVLVGSNVVISALRKIIHDKIRILLHRGHCILRYRGADGAGSLHEVSV